MAVWFPEAGRPRPSSGVHIMLTHRAVPAQLGSCRGCRGEDREKRGSHGGEAPALRGAAPPPSLSSSPGLSVPWVQMWHLLPLRGFSVVSCKSFVSSSCSVSVLLPLSFFSRLCSRTSPLKPLL